MNRRKLLGTSVLVILIIMVGGCDLFTLGGRDRRKRSRGAEENYGSIVITFPEALDRHMGSNSLNTADIIAATNILEVSVFPATASPMGITEGDMPTLVAHHILDELSADGGAIELELPPGTYRVLVLAGYRSGTTAVLLGSGATDPVVDVQANTITEAPITMYSISHTITHPAEVPAGGTYSAEASGDTRNSLLTLEPMGTTSTYKAQFRLDESTSYSELPLEISGSAWFGSVECVASVFPGESGWRFSGPYITYRDAHTGAYAALDGAFPTKWRWLTATVISESSPLWSEVWKAFTVQGITTGMAISVEWPELE